MLRQLDVDKIYWLWNGSAVEGPVSGQVVLQRMADGQCVPEAKVMAVDSQEWHALQTIQTVTPAIEPLPTTQTESSSTPLTGSKRSVFGLIRAVGQALLAVLAAVGAVLAGVARLASHAKAGLGGAEAAEHGGGIAHAIDSLPRSRDSQEYISVRHLGGIEHLWKWYSSHQAVIDLAILILVTVVVTLVLERLLVANRSGLITKRFFRIVIGLSVLLLIGQIITAILLSVPQTEGAPSTVYAFSLGETLITLAVLIILGTSYIGLLFVKSWARSCFACSIASMLIITLFTGPDVQSPGEEFIGTLYDYSVAAVLGIAYFSTLFNSIGPRCGSIDS